MTTSNPDERAMMRHLCLPGLWLLLTLASVSCSYAQELQLRWGTKSKTLFHEISATADQNGAIRPAPRPGERRYRFFTRTSEGSTVEQDFVRQQSRMWERYREEVPSASARSRQGFAAFVKQKDVVLAGTLYALAPRLYFDFVGLSGKQYVLDSITIQTIRFDEYAGGGFFDNTAWYDIELRHTPGTKTYPVERRLRFSGSGSAELRFWSDNYNSTSGMTPVGCYLINITFNFERDGRAVRVSTGAFKIDV